MQRVRQCSPGVFDEQANDSGVPAALDVQLLLDTDATALAAIAGVTIEGPVCWCSNIA